MKLQSVVRISISRNEPKALLNTRRSLEAPMTHDTIKEVGLRKTASNGKQGRILKRTGTAEASDQPKYSVRESQKQSVRSSVRMSNIGFGRKSIDSR